MSYSTYIDTELPVLLGGCVEDDQYIDDTNDEMED